MFDTDAVLAGLNDYPILQSLAAIGLLALLAAAARRLR